MKAFGGVRTKAWESLRLAIDYAESRGLGLIEADSITIDGVIAQQLAQRPRPEPVDVRSDLMNDIEVDGSIEPRNPKTTTKPRRLAWPS